MSAYCYDLHLHSCLSPCGDNDMTPNNIAGMAMLAGIQIAALTDHNSCKNCPAFYQACERAGVLPVAGMELTTAEDIHLVCLFERLEQAMAFDEAVAKNRILIPNRVDIFGEQLILDGEDTLVGTEPHLLPNATQLSLEDAVSLAQAHGAAVYPAHVDRESNGIIAILGTLPEKPDFPAAEFHSAEMIAKYRVLYPELADKRTVVCSDAHYLHNIPDAANSVELAGETPEELRHSLIAYLKGC